MSQLKETILYLRKEQPLPSIGVQQNELINLHGYLSVRLQTLLHKTTVDFQTYRTMCTPSSAIISYILRPEHTDCPLYLWRSFVTEVSKRNRSKFSIYPSAYYLYNTNCSRYEMQFYNFTDLCNELKLDVAIAENGVILEKRSRNRQTQKVQLLGTIVRWNNQDSTPIVNPKTILIASTAAPNSFAVHGLHLDSLEWNGHDFVYDFEYFRAKFCDSKIIPNGMQLGTMSNVESCTNGDK